jgi:hypothetical protein
MEKQCHWVELRAVRFSRRYENVMFLATARASLYGFKNTTKYFATLWAAAIFHTCTYTITAQRRHALQQLNMFQHLAAQVHGVDIK